MLRSASMIQGLFTIHAVDGDIGRVDQFYFDDEEWIVRYVVVDITPWREGKYVLITPTDVIATNWEEKTIDVALTTEQVRNSPDVDQHQPVSRRHETQYGDYYGWPYYWAHGGLWGPGYQSSSQMMDSAKAAAQEHTSETLPSNEPGDLHLRSTREVIGYHLEALDGPIGHIEDFLMDDDTWAIQYLVIDTRNWWYGKTVLISPGSIKRLDWAKARVYVDLPRARINNAAELERITTAKEGAQHSVPAQLR